ncbi:MAG TPA: PrsW family glutamic-type intramembrane protease, partial [Anaerolineales bacterium]|nr:PrsW family glutamic-type intramembrane protease [Anaerolineales bacterium]
MQTKNTHWPSILILIVLGTSVLFVFLFIAATGISSIIDLFSESGDPAGEMISTFAFGFELLVLLVCMWFVFQKAQSREQADLQFKFPFANWQILAVLGLIGLSVMLGAAVIYTEVIALAWVVLPFLTLLVIVPPIWIFFGLGTKGIDFGSRWRVFSILGLGMTLAPVTMIVLELIILFVIIIAGTVFLALSQPDLLQEVAAVGRILQNETDQDVILNLVAPYLSSPAVIATLIGYIGFIVPLIEELLKPLGVWLFARKFTSPAQGFAMGMLSGGAFALVESLNASGNGSAEWVVVVSVRAGTSLLHMVASGLVGW